MKARTILNIGVTAIFAVVVATVTLIGVRGAAASRPKSLPELGSVPEFTLVEASGQALARSDLREKVWVASFIFTRCAEVCPAMMRTEVKLQRELPVRDDVKLVTFSVDPEHDTPAVLREYAATFGVNRAGWWLVTGKKEEIYRLALEGFRLSTMDADPAKEMPILHSTKLVLVDRRGTIRGYYDSTDEGEVRQLVKDLRAVLAERS